MSQYQNKRTSKRVKTRVRINCKGEGIFFSDFTRDISLHGIGIETVALIEQGTVVELFFNLPGEHEPIVAKGRVVWSNIKQHGNGDNSMNVVLGIEFKDINDTHQSKLSSFLENDTSQA